MNHYVLNDIQSVIVITLFLMSITCLSAACSVESATWNGVQKEEEISGSKVFIGGQDGYDTYRIPAIVKSSKGTLLAFCEGRKNGRSDSGDIDLILRRSQDGGKTWSKIITVWDDGHNTCGNPSPVVDSQTGRIHLLMTWNKGEDNEQEIRENKGIGTRRVFVTFSDDDGQSWAKPVDITASAKKPEWTWYATGPCHSIQIGSGRIIVPCNHGNIVNGRSTGTTSHLIFSDDHGKSWHIGAVAPVGNESTVAELRNGEILLNMRKNKKGEWQAYTGRLGIKSSDGGESFGEPFVMEDLVEPICNASMINYAPGGRKTSKILFSNPADSARRINLTLKLSKNGGRTWRKVFTLTEGPAAYSDLCVMPDGSVIVLYESGKESPYENISVSRIPARVIR